MHRLVLAALALLGLLAVARVAFRAAVERSPVPRAMLVRVALHLGGEVASAKLARLVPPGITERPDLAYDPADPDARLDLFLPPGHRPGHAPPLVAWVHGGAWVAGSKGQVANYLRILAGRGYAVAGIDYTLAPRATHPTPVRQ